MSQASKRYKAGHPPFAKLYIHPATRYTTVVAGQRNLENKGAKSLYSAVIFWVSCAVLGVILLLLLMRGFFSLPPEQAADSNDIHLYYSTGEAVLRGAVPYRDFFIEYPPGSIPAFVPPALFSGSQSAYATYFAVEMSLLLVLALLLVALAARKLWGNRSWLVPAAAFVAGSALLYPVTTVRYDPVVALTLAAAALCAAYGRPYFPLAYASLSFGAAAKLIPVLATLPLAALGRGERVREKLRSAARGYVVFFVVLALFFVPTFLLGERGLVESFAYQAGRGLQLESLASSVLLRLGWVREVNFEYGAFDVHGRGVKLAISLSPLITIALLIVTSLAVYREHAKGRLGPEKFPRYAAAFILAFMLGSKVLSPQYVIWLLPLVPLSAGGFAGAGVSVIFLAACWTTTQVYPFHYDELRLGLQPAVDLLLGRNLLLVVLWGLMLILPAGKTRESRT